MAESRHCSGTITEVYEITGGNLIETYEEALNIVRTYDDDITFDVHTFFEETPSGFNVIGQLNVYR